MSSEYTPASGNRSARRSGRRSGRTRTRKELSVQPKKETLWQKITSFFLGKSAEAPPARKSVEKPTSGNGDSTPPRRPARSAGLRKPEIVEVSSPRIYVGNLSFEASEGDLFELFNGVGSVQNVEIVSNKHTQKSKGFAFVQMQSIDEAKRAVAELHDKDYMGRKLVVSGAKAVEEKRGERRQSDQ
jgi:RNA recognition motif-containing protein